MKEDGMTKNSGEGSSSTQMHVEHEHVSKNTHSY